MAFRLVNNNNDETKDDQNEEENTSPSSSILLISNVSLHEQESRDEGIENHLPRGCIQLLHGVLDLNSGLLDVIFNAV